MISLFSRAAAPAFEQDVAAAVRAAYVAVAHAVLVRPGVVAERPDAVVYDHVAQPFV